MRNRGKHHQRLAAARAQLLGSGNYGVGGIQEGSVPIPPSPASWQRTRLAPGPRILTWPSARRVGEIRRYSRPLITDGSGRRQIVALRGDPPRTAQYGTGPKPTASRMAIRHSRISVAGIPKGGRGMGRLFRKGSGLSAIPEHKEKKTTPRSSRAISMPTIDYVLEGQEVDAVPPAPFPSVFEQNDSYFRFISTGFAPAAIKNSIVPESCRLHHKLSRGPANFVTRAAPALPGLGRGKSSKGASTTTARGPGKTGGRGEPSAAGQCTKLV